MAFGPNRRSLRDRLREGIVQNIPFQAKSRSVDASFHIPNPFANDDQPPPATPKVEAQLYVVRENDTITSIAASFDLTPSELIKANRLNTRMIFPGQSLKIPPKSHDTNSSFQKHFQNKTPKNSPVKDVKVIEAQQRKFIKINVRHITDGNGVVSGVLLVTPNAVMFDPNVSDPLVLEQGAETYGVILPLDVVIHAGLYSDICLMRVKGKVVDGPKPDLYPHDSTPSATSAPSASQEPKLSDEPPLVAPPPPPPIPQVPDQSTEEPFLHDSGFETGRPSPSPHLEPEPSNEETRKQKVLKRLSFPLTWMESLSGAPNTKEETQSAPPESKINYRSLVSLEDMPGLFASFDKLMPAINVNVKNDDPPWYLCLTMGKPKNKKLRSGIIVSYGQKKSIKPEYWFSIPRDQTEDLYKFWMLWWPHLYGELDEKLVADRGYELVDWDTELFESASSGSPSEEVPEGGSDLKGELNELTKESWEMIKAPYVKFYSFIRSQCTSQEAEVVSMSEELRRALYGSEEFVPELIGVSEILEEDDVKNLGNNLTARAEGYPWVLVFSTSRDGFSLNSLYRKMQQDVESPILILIEDTLKRVFGALVSCPLRVSDHFYGTGQSFLFTCRPDFVVYKWTGENMYFIKGNYESLAIGSGDGKFGLWLDGDLNIGRSEETATYGNPPLVPETDFTIKTLECWAFGR